MNNLKRYSVAIFVGLLLCSSISAGEKQTLFNGKNLDGWSGNPDLWKVADGAIVGSTVDKKIGGNTFLVWDGGDVADFKLTLEAKIEGNNNSGIQYRSKLADPKTWRVIGYQADIHPAARYTGMLYGEGIGRGIVAQRGTKVVVDAKSGKPKVVENTEKVEPIKISEWHEYTIIARGNQLVHKIDGKVAVEITDNHAKKLDSGIIALQLHAGGPMTAHFRNIVLEKLGGDSANAAAAEPKKAQLNAPPEGFSALFNGKDLIGWKGLVGNPKTRAAMAPEQLAKAQASADERARKHWIVEDGVIVFDGKGQSLCTAKDYANFEMYVDWKIKPRGDSGIYLRGTPQVQIWDPNQHKVGSGGLFNNKKNPSKPSEIADNPIGEWNTFYIKMVGENVTIKLNDKLVVDNVVLENYWERDKSIYPTGQIELQNHGNTLWFRNIFIRELP
jgi:hypothetical protein